MSDYTFIKAKADTPDHMICEKSDCKYLKVDGSRFCPRHGANKDLQRKANKMAYDFKLERVRAKTNILAADPKRYRLDEELAILRLTLEDTVNKITVENSDDPYALFRSSDTIKNLIGSIEKLAQTCITQSRHLKLLLTVDDLLQEVQQIVDIIAEEVDDDEITIRIANRIAASFAKTYDLGAAKEQDDIPSLELDDPEQAD